MNSRLKERIRPPLPEGPVLVVGLGRSGQAVARMLAERGLEVRGCDSGSPKGAESLFSAGVEVELESESVDLLEGVSTVVKSPGVPSDTSLLTAADAKGIETLGELEVAWRALDNRFCAVTGTNGKSTVTQMIAWIFDRAGVPAEAAGNLGTPLASLVGKLSPETTVVCECSSYQLEDADSFSPEIAVLLNLAPDHLDRHKTMSAYLDAKLRIFSRQVSGDFAVINGSDEAFSGIDVPGGGSEIRFCSGGRALRGPCDALVADGSISWRGEEVVQLSDLSLSGEHNFENAAAAVAASICSGIEPAAVAEGLASFEGIPHRLELVASHDGVTFVNDSKATNVAAAVAGIESAEGEVRVILGGSLKDESFEPLLEVVRERCRGCYISGQAAGAIEEALAPARDSGVEVKVLGSFEAAVEAAADDAVAGETVLLSPACASFDEFEDFERRGDAFRELVERRVSR